MGFIERMKWWQWTGLSLLLGALLAFLNTGVNDTAVDHGSVSTVVFEGDLLSKPWVDPKNPNNVKAWMSDIVVHPTHEIMVGGQPIQSQLVSFTQFTAPTPLHPSGESSQQYLLAPFPYEPTPRSGPTRTRLMYPAASLYYGKAGDTVNSLAARFYHKDTSEGERAIIRANSSLRAPKPGVSEFQITKGAPYWIPWNPGDQHTISDFLKAANQYVKQQQGAAAIPITFHFHWWESSKYGYQMWMIGTFLIVGVIWPTLLTVMLKGGLGRMTSEEYDLSRFKGAPQPAEPAKAPAAAATESDMQKLRDLETSMAESVKGFAITGASAAAVETAPEAVAEIKKLAGGPAEAVAAPKPQEEPKAYTGEFYPVVKSSGHADTDEKK